MTHGRTLGIYVLLFAVLGAIAAEGCGGSDRQGSATSTDSPITVANHQLSSRSGPLRAVKWWVGRRGEASIQIGAFVPYCEGTEPTPRIEKVAQRRRPGGVILTMYVRFPSRKGGNCVGYDLGVTRWVRVGKQAMRSSIYDGSMSPPALRVRG